MNIVFLLRLWPLYGGGETVTIRLANEMVKRGHTVSILFFKDHTKKDLPYINEDIRATKIPNILCNEYTADFSVAVKVQEYLLEYIKENHINIVINQWWPVEYIIGIKGKTKAKIIKCLHQAFYTKSPIEGWKFKSVLKRIFLSYYRLYEKKRGLYEVKSFLPHCDKYIFLSPSFEAQFKKMSKYSDTNNLLTFVHNPLNNYSLSEAEFKNKKKEVLFVGRLEEGQKKVSRILKIWSIVCKEPSLTDWILVIVGEGRDKKMYENIAKRLQLKNIEFKGFQDPTEYYKRAQIFVMTSAFEGWGMTLLEALQNRVVPIVMDTYLSLHDIIKNGENGIILPDTNINKYANSLIKLMKNDDLRLELSLESVKRCQQYSVERIVDKWEYIINDINNKQEILT